MHSPNNYYIQAVRDSCPNNQENTIELNEMSTWICYMVMDGDICDETKNNEYNTAIFIIGNAPYLQQFINVLKETADVFEAQLERLPSRRLYSRNLDDMYKLRLITRWTIRYNFCVRLIADLQEILEHA